ncbi:MAG: hypothetical protein HRF45_01990 [Fimbriimonadia bacterium]
MRRRRSRLKRGWWVSSVLFVAAVLVGWLVWWVPAQRLQTPLDVRFVDAPAGDGR